jgi:hypothetical protein
VAVGSDDQADELENGDHVIHAAYMIPSDGHDRLAAVADALQTDAFQASALVERLYGRAFRYDMGTSCGPQYLDITFIRMTATRQQLREAAGTEDGTLSAVQDELDARGFFGGPRVSNFVVWLDGPSPSGACGQANLYADPRRGAVNPLNNGGLTAVIFRSGDHFCDSNTVRHEITHTLGAVQPQTPNSNGGGHCTDAFEDTMCAHSAPPVTSTGLRQALFYDYNNDDYWDPSGSLPWWTVDESPFICPDATCNIPPDTPVVENDEPVSLPVGHVFTPSPARVARRPRLTARAHRLASRRSWRVKLRIRGSGAALVVARCRMRHGTRRHVVTRRRVALPRHLRLTVRPCVDRPRMRLRLRQS